MYIYFPTNKVCDEHVVGKSCDRAGLCEVWRQVEVTNVDVSLENGSVGKK